ncbi:MAG TPA: TIGR03435 family protein [Acidobacteriaceae bacterium]
MREKWSEGPGKIRERIRVLARLWGMGFSFRRMLVCAAGMVFVLGAALSAQTIAGTWQGTLPIADNPRVAIKLVHGDDGALHGVLYQLDKGPAAVALSAVTFAAPEVTITQIELGVSFQGQLSADGKSMRGTWTQDKTPGAHQDKLTSPLTLTLATAETLWKRTAPGALPPMSPTADPAFEVATIKPSSPDSRFSFKWRTRDFVTTNRTVKDLMEFVYQVQDRQISGGPAWMNDARFDIAGEPDAEGLPSIDQYRLMLKKLLASRFGLQLHTVQQTLPVYALTRDETAAKLPHADPGLDIDQIYVSDAGGGQKALHFSSFSMPQLAEILMRFIPDRQIVDETGLAGNFEFILNMPASDLDGGDGGPEDHRPDGLRRAIGTLGFHLVPKKEHVPVLVIDQLNQPTPN